MLVFSLVAHEYAHGFAALKQGDETALEQGRLTFNPIPHIDPWLTVIMPALLWFGSKGAFTFGGARPVEVALQYQFSVLAHQQTVQARHALTFRHRGVKAGLAQHARR